MSNAFYAEIRIICVLIIAFVYFSPPLYAAKTTKTAENLRLANSASPYLRSHSKDLVQWYPWGEDAFHVARKTNRPILVSFGYTACHWCHVMQEKHFNAPHIAKIINDQFVPVLVDRERRASLDETYMLVTESMTQRGGWPNTVFLTPDLKPFYGTAYVPPEVFSQVLESMNRTWLTQKASLIDQANRMANVLSRYVNRKEKSAVLNQDVFEGTAKGIAFRFDPFKGGLGTAPKFFRPSVLMFLLQQYERSGEDVLLDSVETTLNSGISGGIHDHLEGGFHRYTVDPAWRVPHFEKMLSDQALMAEILINTYRITGKKEYADTARKTLDYILADMTSPEGAFYTARDADSEGEEGTYYVWSPQQLEKVLGKSDAALAIKTFGLQTEGDFTGKIILNLDQVDKNNIKQIHGFFANLKKVRDKRQKPIRDEKVLTAWNGMTIASLALNANILNEPKYLNAAKRAGHFIWNTMRDKNGHLFRSYFKGARSVEAQLDDYAHLARAYIFLFDTTREKVWFDRALKIIQLSYDGFEDKETGDFYATRQVEAFARMKPRTDNDIPSANGVMLDVLTLLYRRSLDVQYKGKVEKVLAALSGLALKDPTGGVSILHAADQFQRGEVGHIQYAGRGVVRIAQLRSDKENKKIVFQLQIADGWHINSNKPLEEHLIATSLKLSHRGKPVDVKLTFPKPITKKLSFNDKPVAIFENSIEVIAHITEPNVQKIHAELEVQTCSDTICLLPEKIVMKVIN